MTTQSMNLPLSAHMFKLVAKNKPKFALNFLFHFDWRQFFMQETKEKHSSILPGPGIYLSQTDAQQDGR